MSAALGFRAKTGRAIGVALALERGVARLLWRGEIALIPADYPHAEGPYHPYLELPWDEACAAVQPMIERIERVAREALAPLVKEWKARAIGVVGSPERPLDRIGNEHIRAHAAEGILFRRVLEAAAKHHRIRCAGFSDKQPLPRVDLGDLARQAGPPWRADERAAATAALLALGE